MEATQYAERRGWRVRTGGGPAWGFLYRPLADREGCVVPIWSTQTNLGNHAKGIKTLTRRLVDGLHEAGCDHATIAFRNGELAIDYDRKAMSLDRALAGGVKQLVEHGYRIRRIEIDISRGKRR